MIWVELGEIVSWLNDYLDIGSYPDDQSVNGLQVEAGPGVERVATAVDACQMVFDKSEADLLMVHHGLYWKGVSPVVAKEMASRVGKLLEQGTSLYAAHLPLDAHPEVGNNVQLIRSLGLEPEKVGGILWKAEFGGSWEELLELAAGKVGEPGTVLEFGPQEVEEVFVCSGGGTSEIFGLPAGATYLTGEFSHYGYHYAREKRVNVAALGHYATETFGVRALGDKLKDEFGLKTGFIDAPTGM